MKRLAPFLPILWLTYLWQDLPASAQSWSPGGQGIPIVCAYNTSPPTVSSGLFVYAQCNSSGAVLTVSGGPGGASAVYPSGGTAGSSNGTGQTDSNAFSVAPSGPSIAAWSVPSSCTQPAGFGFQYYLQCLITGVYSPLAPQASGAAVGIGAIKLCDQASTANPLTPCAGVNANNSLQVGGIKASGAYSAQTVGAADSTILAASTAVSFLDIVNVSNTATMCINFGSAATIAGTQCAAGEYPFPPGWHRSWEGSFIPTDAIHAIASAAGTQVTVGVK